MLVAAKAGDLILWDSRTAAWPRPSRVFADVIVVVIVVLLLLLVVAVVVVLCGSFGNKNESALMIDSSELGKTMSSAARFSMCCSQVHCNTPALPSALEEFAENPQARCVCHCTCHRSIGDTASLSVALRTWRTVKLLGRQFVKSDMCLGQVDSTSTVRHGVSSFQCLPISWSFSSNFNNPL